MVAGRFIEAGNEMIAARPRCTGADANPAGSLGLTGGGQRRAFLMPHPDPLNRAAPDRIGEGIKRIPDQSEHMLDADLLERADQNIRNCLRH